MLGTQEVPSVRNAPGRPVGLKSLPRSVLPARSCGFPAVGRGFRSALPRTPARSNRARRSNRVSCASAERALRLFGSSCASVERGLAHPRERLHEDGAGLACVLQIFRSHSIAFCGTVALDPRRGSSLGGARASVEGGEAKGARRMRRLRATDGTEPHRRAIRYHMSMCLFGKAPIHEALRLEAKSTYDALVAKAREGEDAKDAFVAAGAASDAAELAFEDTIRNIDGDLASADRASPELAAQSTVFPNGFGAEIEPDGDAQLGVLPDLKARLAKLSGHPVGPASLATLEAAETALKNAFKAEDDASDLVDKLFAEENEARREVREQLESAYGQLRSFYKSKPAMAERFFLKEGRARKGAKQPPEGGSAPPAGGGAPA